MVAFEQLGIAVDVQLGELHPQSIGDLADGRPCGLAKVASLAHQQLNLMQCTHPFIFS